MRVAGEVDSLAEGVRFVKCTLQDTLLGEHNIQHRYSVEAHAFKEYYIELPPPFSWYPLWLSLLNSPSELVSCVKPQSDRYRFCGGFYSTNRYF